MVIIMRIVIAPDSFKGSLSALAAASAIREGFSRVWPEAEYLLFPIADGGEGTVEVLVESGGGVLVRERVSDALGRPVEAAWGLLQDGRSAVVEVAAASGLASLKLEELNPAGASSYGSGQLIKKALNRGVRKLIVGLGGSATNDGGTGLMRALGVRFLNADGRELPPGGLALRELSKIDLSGLDERLRETEVIVASDVLNPLCGPEGASAVFGPQKGAGPEMVSALDQALEHYADIAAGQLGLEVKNRPGAGAAGGLGAAFMLFTPNAVFRPGIDLILEEKRFDDLAAGACFIVSGEGRSDAQSAFGKGPAGIIRRGRSLGVPVYILSGSLGEGYEKLYDLGVCGIASSCPGPVGLPEAIRLARPFLTDGAARLAQVIHSSATVLLS